jgi:hypothetical protein
VSDANASAAFPAVERRLRLSYNVANCQFSSPRFRSSEKRRFRNVLLGLKSKMDKGQAKQKLRDLIARETRNIAPSPVAVTLRWFYENRFLPQKEEQWKVTSRPKTKRFIENYLLKRFGDFLLADLDKFTLQTYLNELAPNLSKSVLAKARVYLNAILGEAVKLEESGSETRRATLRQESRNP